jgi:DNA-binding NtrC family response regulator
MTTANILLVDDEIQFVETMTRRLSKRGVNALTAFSGQEALELLAAGKEVDIVVLDIKMPGMNGLETLKQIKKQNPSIDVIILTGQSTVDTAIKGMKLGAFDFLTKPCELEELVRIIKDAMKLSKNRR